LNRLNTVASVMPGFMSSKTQKAGQLSLSGKALAIIDISAGMETFLEGALLPFP